MHVASQSRLTVDDGVRALIRDVAYGVLETTEVRLVEGARETARGGRADALHQERDAEGVKALADKVVDRRRLGPGVLLAELAGDDVVPELGAGLVDTEQLELGGRAWAERVARAGRRCGRRGAANLAL